MFDLSADDLSAIFGGVALATKLATAYVQAKKPDAKSIREIQLFSLLTGALSYGAMGNRLGTFQYTSALLRSYLRTKPWGNKHKKSLAATMTLTIAAFTFLEYRSLQDLLPLTASALGSLADYSGQGRYQRLLFGTAIASTVPFAALSGNDFMTAAGSVHAFLVAKSIYTHDIKNAAGEGKSLTQNFMAYAYGIARNAVTGAPKETQVPINTTADKTDEAIEEAYARLNDNPRYPRPDCTHP